jgi:hypothetical protein
MLHSMSRCGLGLASPNATLATLKDFPQIYTNRLASPETYPGFKLDTALQDAYKITGREPPSAVQAAHATEQA